MVGDHTFAYRDSTPDQVRIAFGSADGEHIHDWRRQLSFTPGKRAGSDYEFTTPNIKLDTVTPSLIKVPGNVNYELYEYPARALSREASERATRLRIQATETDFDRIEGRSSVRTLAAGHRFSPYEVAHPAHVYEPQVVSAILHRAEDPTYETGAGTPHYENEFQVMPAAIPATPHRTTPRPRIDGLQIAKIAGPAGEEIHTDAFGRVKLTFPWDRRAKADGTDTGWVRVSQSWGGGTWGQQVIPRVGMEALIAFQEGDPDRPIVVGIVPNPNNPVPYDLPANKTRMTLRSNSYKSKGFNEMTFEDATGGENMFFHAQKDHTTRIENNQTISIGANHAQVVGQNQAITVGQNMTFEAGKSINMTIGGTGKGAAALMLPFAGMAGVTSTILTQALTSALEPDSGETGASPVSSEQSGSITAMTPQLAGSLIGLLTGDGPKAQQDVWHGPNPRSDAGTALAASGSLFGNATGKLFNLPGIHNHITGTMKTDHIGCARVEQVGTSKVTHVGSTFGTKVGKIWSMSVGKDAITRTGHDWSVGAHHDASLTAGNRFVAHAGHTAAIVSDDAGFIVAKEILTQSAKSIVLHATDAITLNVGDNNSITIDKDGTITLAASKAIVISAGEQVALKAGGASLTVGPGKVQSEPMVVEGSADIAAVVGIGVKNVAKDEFKLPGFIADFLGFAAMKVSKLPWVGRQEKAVSDQFTPEAIQERRDDPVYQGMTDGFNWNSIQWPWK